MHGVSLASIFLRAFETWCSAFVLMLALVLAMDKCTVTAIVLVSSSNYASLMVADGLCCKAVRHLESNTVVDPMLSIPIQAQGISCTPT